MYLDGVVVLFGETVVTVDEDDELSDAEERERGVVALDFAFVFLCWGMVVFTQCGDGFFG